MGKTKEFCEEKRAAHQRSSTNYCTQKRTSHRIPKTTPGPPQKSSSPAIITNQALSPTELNNSDPASKKVAPTQPKLNMVCSTAGRPMSRPRYRDWKAPEIARYLARAANARMSAEYPNKVTG